SDQLSANCISLEITNLRVIKKIERLCDRLAELLGEYDPTVLKQAVHTVTLFGWICHQPDLGPSLEFVRRYNGFVDLLSQDGDAPDQQKAWSALLHTYGFTNVDELDSAILAGVQAGYFDEGSLKAAAATLSRRAEYQMKDDSFSRAWERYHYSFQTGAEE